MMHVPLTTNKTFTRVLTLTLSVTESYPLLIDLILNLMLLCCQSKMYVGRFLTGE